MQIIYLIALCYIQGDTTEYENIDQTKSFDKRSLTPILLIEIGLGFSFGKLNYRQSRHLSTIQAKYKSLTNGIKENNLGKLINKKSSR